MASPSIKQTADALSPTAGTDELAATLEDVLSRLAALEKAVFGSSPT